VRTAAANQEMILDDGNRLSGLGQHDGRALSTWAAADSAAARA
jgi:hypothetical protein